MKSILAVVEGTQEQSTDEQIPWSIDTTQWGDDPTSPTAVAVDEYTDETVTSTVFPTNSPSVSDNVITLSPLKSLTKGHTYRIEVKFTISTTVWECYFKVKCTI
jgi:hypothetical protein